MTPALHILGLPMPLAVGTTLTQMVASSLTGTIKHRAQQNVSIPLVMIFGLPGIMGVLLGKTLMVQLASHKLLLDYFSLAYAGFLIFMAILMVKRILRPRVVNPSKIWTFGPRWDSRQGTYGFAYIPCAIFGSFIGVVSGLTGLGGGFFYMPIMSQVLGIPLKVSVGSSLGIVVISALAGSVSYGLAGLSDIRTALIIAVGAIGGSFLGASATQYVTGKTLKLLFAVLVICAAVSVVLKYFSYKSESFYLMSIATVILLATALTNAYMNYRKK